MAGGRPTKFKSEYVEQAEKLCRLGANDVELAVFFKINVATLYRWQTRHGEFCEALKVGKKVADDRVERSLFHRACGYSHPDVDIRVVGGKIVKTEIIKHYSPDTTACIFWLKNRKPTEWRDNMEHTHKFP
ncbi:MAG: terminase, partial [Planctomycetes bacterium]|nr:terminase [Planctomycetota bacterium]